MRGKSGSERVFEREIFRVFSEVFRGFKRFFSEVLRGFQRFFRVFFRGFQKSSLAPIRVAPWTFSNLLGISEKLLRGAHSPCASKTPWRTLWKPLFSMINYAANRYRQ